eukprot:4369668-Amphidinium_carterae.1
MTNYLATLYPEPTLDAVLLEDEVADEDDVREVMELENVFEDVEEVVVRVDEVEEKLVVDDSVLVLDDLLVLVVLVVVLVSVFEVDVDVVDVAEYLHTGTNLSTRSGAIFDQCAAHATELTTAVP